MDIYCTRDSIFLKPIENEILAGNWFFRALRVPVDWPAACEPSVFALLRDKVPLLSPETKAPPVLLLLLCFWRRLFISTTGQCNCTVNLMHSIVVFHTCCAALFYRRDYFSFKLLESREHCCSLIVAFYSEKNKGFMFHMFKYSGTLRSYRE